MKKSRFLVTGGAGFVGSHLVDLLVQNDHQVRVIDDFSSGNRENLRDSLNQIELVEGSILDSKLLNECTQDVAGIFHLAAVVSVPASIEQPLQVHDVNLTGTLNVIEAAKSAQAPFVFSSSAAVYGNSSQVPSRESQVASPISHYGVQKLAGEMYANCYQGLFKIPAVSLRYFNIYGPRQDAKSPYSGVITAFATRAVRGDSLTINGDGSHTRDFIYVKDIVRANWLAMQKLLQGEELPPAINIGTSHQITLQELAESIASLAKSTGAINHGPERVGDIHDSCADIKLANSCIGFEPEFDLVSGLAPTVQFFRDSQS